MDGAAPAERSVDGCDVTIEVGSCELTVCYTADAPGVDAIRIPTKAVHALAALGNDALPKATPAKLTRSMVDRTVQAAVYLRGFVGRRYGYDESEWESLPRYYMSLANAIDAHTANEATAPPKCGKVDAPIPGTGGRIIRSELIFSNEENERARCQ